MFESGGGWVVVGMCEKAGWGKGLLRVSDLMALYLRGFVGCLQVQRCDGGRYLMLKYQYPELSGKGDQARNEYPNL